MVPSAWRELGNRVLTSESLFEQKTLPRRMAVIGLGAIGLELSQALSRLGIDITGFDLLKTLGGLSDPEINAALVSRIEKEFPIHRGEKAEVQSSNGVLVVKAGEVHVTVDRVLVAMGVRPNLDGLGMEKLGVAYDDQGKPPVNPCTAQLAHLPVFLAGDANGWRPLLHEALDEGFMAGRNAFASDPDCQSRRTGLRIVFSDPQLAVVGRSHADLENCKVVQGSVDFKNQSRAMIDHRPYGLLKIYAHPESGCLLGSEMACPSAEHLAHLLALAMQHDMTVIDMLRMPFYHPTIEEGLRSALREVAAQLPPGRDPGEMRGCEVCPEPPLG